MSDFCVKCRKLDILSKRVILDGDTLCLCNDCYKELKTTVKDFINKGDTSE